MQSARAQVDWVRVPVDPDLLKALNTTSDAKGWLQAGGHILLTIATGASCVLLWHHQQWWALVVALGVHGAVQGMLGSGVHELVHERVFTTRIYNRFFLALNSFLTAWNYPFFEVSHKDHHRYTLNQPHDLEVVLPAAEALAKKKPTTTLQRLRRYGELYFAWSAIWPAFRRHWDFASGSYPHNDDSGGIWAQVWCKHLFARMDASERSAIRDWSRFFLIAHALICVVSLALGWWIVPLVVTFASFFGSAMVHWCGYPQHAGLVDAVNDFRLCCRTYTASRLSQFLYWNMNYHTEHHMYAAVPCYNLPRLHDAIKEHLPPTHRSLYSTWAEIRQIEFRQSSDPSYQYAQPLPENEPSDGAQHVSRVADLSAEDYLDLTDTPPTGDWKVWECKICGFIYDEALGLPEEGIAPGTRWDEIPNDWACPDCGVAKADFSMIERSRIATGAAPSTAGARDTETGPIVIIGSGLAGYTLARQIRAHDAERDIVLITEDAGTHYSKPMLSNALAAGKSAEALAMKSGTACATEIGIELRANTTVRSIDRERRVVQTDSGALPYSSLVLALGAEQRRLHVDGDAADRVLSVNSLDDYQHFRTHLNADSHVLIIGAGLIGAEFANDLTGSGHRVTVVDLADEPLNAIAPPEIGRALRERLESEGVAFAMGTSVASVDAADERLKATLCNGDEVTCDLVLSAVGLVPRTALAAKAGLETRRGIVTDAALRTSDPRIYALGDCAEVDGCVRFFIAPIRHAAAALAGTLTGSETTADFPPTPIVVKTPIYPVVALTPATNGTSPWALESDSDGLEFHSTDTETGLQGFALGGPAVTRREELLDQVERGAVALQTP